MEKRKITKRLEIQQIKEIAKKKSYKNWKSYMKNYELENKKQ